MFDGEFLKNFESLGVNELNSGKKGLNCSLFVVDDLVKPARKMKGKDIFYGGDKF